MILQKGMVNRKITVKTQLNKKYEETNIKIGKTNNKIKNGEKEK